MRSLPLLSLALALGVALSAAAAASDEPTSPVALTDPTLASIKLPAGATIVEAHQAGDDAVLEEGVARELESSDVGKPELVAEDKPVTHTLDTVALPDSEVESAPSLKLADAAPKDSKPIEAISAAAARGYVRPYCPNKCSLYTKYCSRGCYRRYCYIRYRIKYRIKRRYRIKYPVRVRRRYRVKVRYCTKHGYNPHCYYRWVYKYVYVTIYRYKYVYRYSYVYRYKYKKGIKCSKY